MSFDLTKLVTFFADRWDRRSTPVFLVLALLLLLLPMAASVDLSKISFLWWMIIIIVPVATVTIWWSTTKLPIVPKGNVGFVVAINHEDPHKQTAFGNDFVRVLRELVQGGNLRHQTKFIELNRFHAARIRDAETARRYLIKTRSHFLLYGQIRERSVNGKPNHFLNIHAAVTHSPIPLTVSQEFSTEMGSLLPRKLQIDKEGDVFSFEFTARLTDLVTRYIIGVASLMSGDYLYAIELLEDAKGRLQGINDRVPPVALLGVRIPTRLYEAFQFEMSRLYSNWMVSRDKKFIQELRILVSKVQTLRPDDYPAHLYAAICAFMLDRDTKKAMKDIKQCRTEKDRTWCYSKAFLHAYAGKMRQAISTYHSVFSHPSQNPTVPLQTEEFILDVLSEEPDKVQLYYCLGLINYYGKQDSAAARRDFNSFLMNCPADLFCKERDEATEYIQKIDFKSKSDEQIFND